MFDINLIGHLTIDNVIEDDKKFYTLGAIANVWKALSLIDNSIKTEITPLYIGEALIYSDRTTNRRFSKAVLNKKTLTQHIAKSKIFHLCYLNQFLNFDFIKELDGFVTADICVGKSIPLGILKYIDLLFISDEDTQNLKTIIEKTKGSVLFHHSKGSILYSNNKVYKYDIPEKNYLSDINVLGAGDIFAAAILIEFLKKQFNGGDISLCDAHHETYKILRDQNEKI